MMNFGNRDRWAHRDGNKLLSLEKNYWKQDKEEDKLRMKPFGASSDLFIKIDINACEAAGKSSNNNKTEEFQRGNLRKYQSD